MARSGGGSTEEGISVSFGASEEGREGDGGGGFGVSVDEGAEVVGEGDAGFGPWLRCLGTRGGRMAAKGSPRSSHCSAEVDEVEDGVGDTPFGAGCDGEGGVERAEGLGGVRPSVAEEEGRWKF